MKAVPQKLTQRLGGDQLLIPTISEENTSRQSQYQSQPGKDFPLPSTLILLLTSSLIVILLPGL